MGGGVALLSVAVRSVDAGALVSYNTALSAAGGVLVSESATSTVQMQVRGWEVVHNVAGTVGAGMVLVGAASDAKNHASWTIEACVTADNSVHASVCRDTLGCADEIDIVSVPEMAHLRSVCSAGGGMVLVSIPGNLTGVNVTRNVAQQAAGMVVAGNSGVTIAASNVWANLATCQTGGLICLGN